MAYGESNGHMTTKCQTCDPNKLRAQYLENLEMLFINNRSAVIQCGRLS